MHSPKDMIKSTVIQEAILPYVTTLEMGRKQFQETISIESWANVCIISLHVEDIVC